MARVWRMTTGRLIFIGMMMRAVRIACPIFLVGCTGGLFEAISLDADSEHGTETSGTDSGSEWGTDTAPPPGDTALPPLDYSLTGFAAVSALGVARTTGGEGDPSPVVVTNASDLQRVIDEKGASPRIVFVSGRLTNEESGRIVIRDQSDISILGLGGGAELDGFGLTLSGASNIIIRNLKIHHVNRSDGDAIHISDGAHHIWVDHCELYNVGPLVDENYDGLIDITHAADYITISWCHIRDSLKGLLVGHDDANGDEDSGTFHISYHHNLIERVGAGVPSVRFGDVHIWNHLYRDILHQDGDTGMAVSSRVGACVAIEHSRFVDVYTPVETRQSGDDESLLGRVSLFENDFGVYNTLRDAPTCVLSVPYDYASSVVDLDSLTAVLAKGAGVGKIDIKME